MFQEFCIVDIKTDTTNKKIIIETNKILKTTNQDELEIQIFERATKTPLLFSYSIKEESLIIELKDFPLINTTYILGVKNLKSVIDETLISNIKKRIIFESDITSTINVLSPCMHELVEKLNVKLEEKNDKEDNIINRYYIEIATDNAFNNIVSETFINKKDVEIVLKDDGQYFLRARVQNEKGLYSNWSSIIAFIYKSIKIPEYVKPEENPEYVPEIENDIDKDEPTIILNEFDITSIPEQGVSLKSFLFEFNEEIDELSLDDIVIIRKEVK